MPGPLDFLSGIPIIGPLLGGLFGGGQPQQQQQPQQQPQGGGADPLAALAPLLGAIGQQAPGGLGPLGAALGIGGQGGIGQQVGSSAAGAFLAQQLARIADRPDPAAQAGLQELGRRAAQEPITQNQERVSRELVQQVKDALGPELAQIRQMANERALQVQATAEHREIVARDEFRREVLERLRRLEQTQQRAAAAGGRRY